MQLPIWHVGCFTLGQDWRKDVFLQMQLTLSLIFSYKEENMGEQ